MGHVSAKQNRADELRRARKMVDELQERTAMGRDISQEDMNEFTDILSSVVNVLQRLEMQDNNDDSTTAATLPETVDSSTSDGEVTSCHAVDDSYEEAPRQDVHQMYNGVPRSIRRRKRRQVELRHESFGEDILDETDFSQGLEGYEEGFYPEICDEVSFSDPFAGPAVSILGSGTPSTRRTKTTSSVSEESQCFYCVTHGNKGKCSGTQFCC